MSQTLRQALIIIASVSAGMVLMGSWALHYGPDQAYQAIDRLIILPVLIFFFATALWLILDAAENTDIAVREAFDYEIGGKDE